MSKDLERQLDEMGPEYRAVVARLKAAETAETAQDLRLETRDLRWGFMSQVFGLKSYLTAASLLVLVGLSVHFLFQPSTLNSQPSTLNPQPAYGAREYRLSVDEMIATQNADGSWANDFLSKRNAEALRQSGSPGARVAYKKALRNLRAKGL